MREWHNYCGFFVNYDIFILNQNISGLVNEVIN